VADLLIEVLHQLVDSRFVHFDVRGAEVGLSLDWRPAPHVTALGNPDDLRLVLSEVKRSCLTRVDFAADRAREVPVRNQVVLVDIKVLKHFIELIVCQVDAPVLQIEAKLVPLDEAVVVLVQVSERLAYSLPLHAHLVNNFFEDFVSLQ